MAMTGTTEPRLYLIAPREGEPDGIAERVSLALGTDQIACVRLDLGSADEDRWRRAADYLLPVCHAADVPLVITDHFRLVEPLGMDGVHLSGSRTPLREVRRALGRDRIIGAFAGNSKHRAITLAEAGTDYVALGPIRADDALGDGSLATPELFRWWSEMIEVPVVAEGGLLPEDAAMLRETADFIVPAMGIWDHPDSVEDEITRYVKALAGN